MSELNNTHTIVEKAALAAALQGIEANLAAVTAALNAIAAAAGLLEAPKKAKKNKGGRPKGSRKAKPEADPAAPTGTAPGFGV